MIVKFSSSITHRGAAVEILIETLQALFESLNMGYTAEADPNRDRAVVVRDLNGEIRFRIDTARPYGIYEVRKDNRDSLIATGMRDKRALAKFAVASIRRYEEARYLS